MHPNTLNEMQRNLIEISYRPEIKSICLFVCCIARVIQLKWVYCQGYLIEKAVARFRSWSPLRLPVTETYIPFLISRLQKSKRWWLPSRKGKIVKCFRNNGKPIAYTYWIAAVSEESEASFTLWAGTGTIHYHVIINYVQGNLFLNWLTADIMNMISQCIRQLMAVF